MNVLALSFCFRVLISGPCTDLLQLLSFSEMYTKQVSFW